ncbi:MAG: CDP-2,3-bis-(O-geranylgeranyl)-sn-glycerol synthase [Candidatus Micrarchaeota archaeon]|nr:CDP-2,3-bis-(O-geranylgeranyl)-sn-glycerol synthase [Candidatus Micrarchaeota archaeon]
MAEWAIKTILFILPAYFANSVPVLLGGGQPLDAKLKFSDKRRLLGDGKTIRGFFAGVLAAMTVSAAEWLFLSGTGFDLYDSSLYLYVFAGFLLGMGTMTGDLVGSFIKRRQGIAQGKPSFLLDQLSFLLFALIFAYPVSSHLISLHSALLLFLLTYFVHTIANVIAHKLGLKKVPW